MSVKRSSAPRPPVAEGVKVILTVQVWLGAIVAPVQESAPLEKSPGSAPAIPTEVMVRLAAPLLVTVSVWAALVESMD